MDLADRGGKVAYPDEHALMEEARKIFGGNALLAHHLDVDESMTSRWGRTRRIPKGWRNHLKNLVSPGYESGRRVREARLSYAASAAQPAKDAKVLAKIRTRKAKFSDKHASVIDFIIRRKVFQGDQQSLLAIRVLLERMYPLRDEDWLEVRDIITGGQNNG